MTQILARRLAVACLALAVSVFGAFAQTSTDERIADLIDRMTIQEKAGQMTQLNISVIIDGEENPGDPFTINEEKLRTIVAEYGVGSLFGVWHGALSVERWRDLVERIQKIATEETRLGIPVVFADDSVHGANYLLEGTIVPHNLNIGATWNPELAERLGEITAIETRAKATHWTFAPVCDVTRAPEWSRVFETFGEDPMLAGVMASAVIRGLQGDDMASDFRVAATGKHFLGYSAPRSGRDRPPVYMGLPQLYGTHLPPFEDALDAGVATLMINSGEINGTPVHADGRLLTDLLRDELGFEGVAVSDWADVNKLVEVHKVARNKKEAARMAIEAGMDMSMVAQSVDFAENVVELVETGQLEEWRVDQAVERILRLKFDLGLFENPVGGDDAVALIGSASHHQMSLDAARQSLVLLRNTDGLLPLDGDGDIFVTGPTADALPPVFGSWTYSWQGTEEAWYPDTPTILDAVRDHFGPSRVSYEPGSTYGQVLDLAAAREGAAAADVVVLCLGEIPSTERPGDLDRFELDAAQLDLALAVMDTGTPVVMVMVGNRARPFPSVADDLDAIVWFGHAGPHGPQALAEVLAGDINPSGRLPFSYPRHPGALTTYDRKASEDIGADFQSVGHNALFSFGSGMGYAPFGYSDLEVRPSAGGLRVSAVVTNEGDRPGVEIVKVFVSDLVASVTPHATLLKGFERHELAPGESRRVTMMIDREDLTFVDRDGNRIFEPGAFMVRMGDLEETIELD